MSALNELLSRLGELDIKLWVDDGKLRCSAPEGVMTSALQAEIGSRKLELLGFLDRTNAGQDSDTTDLVRQTRVGDVPLSPGQQRLWTLSEMRTASSVYNISTAFRIRGKLNVPVLERAFDLIQQRHEILRTRFPLSENGTPRQEIPEQLPMLMPVTNIFRDVRRLPEKRQQAEVQRYLSQDVWQPFDVKSDSLWRARLFKVKGKPTSWWRSRLQWYKQDEYVLSITMHHMIFDGGSKHILLGELSTAYNAILKGEHPVLPDLPVQYADFSLWQKQWLHGGEAARQLRYWGEAFSENVAELRVPCDHARTPGMQSAGGAFFFSFPQSLASAVETYAKHERTSTYVVLLSAFFCLMNRYNQQEKFVVCSPLASRSQAELEHLIGYFNNLIPMRAELSGNPSFSEVVSRVKRVAVEALGHQNTPLQEISELPSLARIPLNRAMFSFQDTSTRKLNLEGVETTPIDVRKEAADFDLALYMEKQDSSFGGVLEYNADIFEAITARQLVKNYQNLLTKVLAEPDAPISRLPEYSLTTHQIERTLEEYSKIDRAVVVHLPDQSGLAAYLVLNEDDVPEITEIRAYAREQLPAYLQPVAYLPLDQIPVDENGALDYANLPPVAKHKRVAGSDYVAPRSDLERGLAAVWKEILWLEQEVGVNDHFLDLGGHSLLSVQLVRAIEKMLNRPLPEAAMTRLSTIAEMAVLLEQAEDKEGSFSNAELAAPSMMTNANPLPAGVIKELRAYTASWSGKRATPESLIVGLNTAGTKQPLYWCLQRYGELAQLAKYLGADQPVYGMRSGNKVMVKTPENIRFLAEYYVAEILAMQSEGPFLLGGNCQAARIAFQIADRLKELGHEITLLILHEKFIPQTYTGRVALIFGADSYANPHLAYLKPEKGWGKYFSGGFTLDIVPGSHGKYFTEPNIQPLCAKLRQRIEEAQGLRASVDGHYNSGSIEGRLSASAYRAKIVPLGQLDDVPGKEALLRVSVQNLGAETWLHSDVSGVYVSARWLDASGKIADSLGPRVSLPEAVAAGEAVEVDLLIRIPDKAKNWSLELDMVDEGVTWFGEQGSLTTKLSLGRRSDSARWQGWLSGWTKIKSKL